MQRHHIGTAAVSVSLNKFKLDFSYRGFDGIPISIETERGNRLNESLERFEKMNIGIPERVISVED
jgi:hypothetical protein